MNKFFFITGLFLHLFLILSCTKGNNEIINNSGINTVTASVSSFALASGFFYPGESVTSSISFKNTGNIRWKFWIGYSVKDKSGKWYDIPADTLWLNPGEVSKVSSLSWVVPTSDHIVSGAYLVRMAIWNKIPSDPNSIRLDFIEQADSFSAFNYFETFDNLDTNIWTVINKLTPGFGQFKNENIIVSAGTLSIMYPKNTKDGGELKSVSSKTYKYGTYRSRIKTPPQLPGTYSTLFLYNGNTLDEIDIEIWNDGSYEVNILTWIGEKKKYSKTVFLDFDPSLQFHEYRIDYYPNEVSFWIDNLKVGATSILSEIPASEMWIYLNGWWPKWMTGAPSQIDKYAIYDWIQY